MKEKLSAIVLVPVLMGLLWGAQVKKAVAQDIHNGPSTAQCLARYGPDIEKYARKVEGEQDHEAIREIVMSYSQSHGVDMCKAAGRIYDYVMSDVRTEEEMVEMSKTIYVDSLNHLGAEYCSD